MVQEAVVATNRRVPMRLRQTEMTPVVVGGGETAELAVGVDSADATDVPTSRAAPTAVPATHFHRRISRFAMEISESCVMPLPFRKLAVLAVLADRRGSGWNS